MNSKERVKRAVHFETPDRIPILHAYLWGGVNDLGDELRDIFRKYPSDFSGQMNPDDLTLDNDYAKRALSKCSWTDEWGCVWDYPGIGVEGIPVDGPLYKGWESLAKLEIPFFDNKFPAPADVDTQFAMTAIPGGRLFERMHFLRGFENMLMDIAYDAEEVYLLRDKLLNWQIEHLKPILEMDWVDCLSYMDDWGTQSALLISPEKWRKIFKEPYKKLFSMARDAGKDVYFHSDGMIIDIVDDLIDAGVTILAPQFSCMTAEQLGKFKGKVCFSADIDRQGLMCSGAVKQVEQNVKDWIDTLASPQGGIIGRAEIGPGTPAENAEAAYRTFYEYSFK